MASNPNPRSSEISFETTQEATLFESLINATFSGPRYRLFVDRGTRTEFEVSKSTLELIPWFRVALEWEPPLKELHHEVSAIRIVLQILHYRYSELPGCLSVTGLFLLAEACDFYDIVPHVRPHILHWIEMCWNDEPLHALQAGFERCCCWPLILKVFEGENSARLEHSLNRIATNMFFNGEDWLFRMGSKECEVDDIESVGRGMLSFTNESFLVSSNSH